LEGQAVEARWLLQVRGQQRQLAVLAHPVGAVEAPVAEADALEAAGIENGSVLDIGTLCTLSYHCQDPFTDVFAAGADIIKNRPVHGVFP
jgi:hypothetical protein